MMEASDLWERDDLAGLGWVYRADLRTILSSERCVLVEW
jgi:hypothetical protein